MLRSQLRRGVWHVLIKWEGLSAADATWEPVTDFRAAFPDFQLEDELFPKGECTSVGVVAEEEERTHDLLVNL